MALLVTQITAVGEEVAGHQRTQEIALQRGWNAVFLEVEPLETAPGKVFGSLPVDKVATLFQQPTSNQFVTDPGVDLFDGQGWGVWYAPGLPEAFLKSLDAINGNRAYLVHATRDCQWRALGRVELAPVKWQADAFNLVGFPVRAPGGPTFAQFFAGSPAHANQAIYRLVNGRWKKVVQASSETMKSGEAFWAYCKGPSDYQGPLRVETASREGLLLGRGAGEIILRNECPHPLAPTMDHVPADGPAVPLSILVRAYGDPAAPIQPVATPMPAGAWQQPMPPLEVKASIAVPFECRASAMSQPRQGSLLKITTDLGTESWIPVSGFRDDLGE
ncbi:hypothetical protein [Luteolibacter marinus]|uniref:hypothetical protein n=1 Tax=Luteolibacter marinus TaxID=2776705 RepID=UPI0018666EB5|nr:hypothetical protein [Luteolibacter marinus]